MEKKDIIKLKKVTNRVVKILASGFLTCLLLYFNYLLIKDINSGYEFSVNERFAITFVNMIGVVLIALPFIVSLLSKVENNTVRTFLDLPAKDSKLTFLTYSGFLSDQALASFLATILIVTGREAISEYHWLFASLYVVLLFVIAIVLSTVSLVRFIYHFVNYNTIYYLFAAFVSLGITFAFFEVGIKLAN